MNTVAAILRGHDNDTYMVASCTKRLEGVPESVFCYRCGWKIDWRYIRSDFRLGKRRKDISATYDGVIIISSRVRELFQAFGIADTLYLRIPLESDFYVLAPETTVRFDIKRRRTRMEDFCGTCGLHASVIGSSPAYFTSLPEGEAWIAKSDVLFGSFHEHHPLIVVSRDIANALQSGSFSGIELENIKAEQVAGGDAAR